MIGYSLVCVRVLLFELSSIVCETAIAIRTPQPARKPQPSRSPPGTSGEGMGKITGTLSRGIGAELSSPPSKLFHLFSETELAAAAQLVQLSESDDSEVDLVCASCSPARSVNTCHPPLGRGTEAAEDDVDDDEVGGARRRKPRYRRIADLYGSTSPIQNGSKP